MMDLHFRAATRQDMLQFLLRENAAIDNGQGASPRYTLKRGISIDEFKIVNVLVDPVYDANGDLVTPAVTEDEGWHYNVRLSGNKVAAGQAFVALLVKAENAQDRVISDALKARILAKYGKAVTQVRTYLDATGVALIEVDDGEGGKRYTAEVPKRVWL